MREIMKIVFVFLLLLLFSDNVFGQADTVYTVRIGAFVSPEFRDFEDLHSIGFVHADSLTVDLKTVSVGRYSTEGKATKIAFKIQQAGFPDANVQPILLRSKEEMRVIQMATLKIGNSVKWEQFFKAYPDILVHQADDKLIIFAGGFENEAASSSTLPGIRNAGFTGAFTKMYPKANLIPVTEFEAGKIEVVALIPEKAAEKKAVEPKSEKEPKVVPKIPEPAPQPTSEPKITPSAVKPVAKRKVNYPEINGKIKRNSSIELQRTLKVAGYDPNGVDGYYGKGTASAYNDFVKASRQWKKYEMLSKFWNTGSGDVKTGELQQAIYNAFENTESSLKVFDKNSNPLAVAYRAFIEFSQGGASRSVNDKMNEAIKQAFPSKKLNNTGLFDYNSTYSYQDQEQLIRHLKYLHMASEENLAVPCWLFAAYPKETTAVFGGTNRYLNYEDCTGVMDWEEIRVLTTLASDLADNTNAHKLAKASAKRAKKLLTPSNLTKVEKVKADKWNSTLIGNLTGWASRDPMNKKLITNFKVAYYQSQVRLEDYFILKDIRPDEARYLSLAILNTLVGDYLSRFTE